MLDFCFVDVVQLESNATCIGVDIIQKVVREILGELNSLFFVCAHCLGYTCGLDFYFVLLLSKASR